MQVIYCCKIPIKLHDNCPTCLIKMVDPLKIKLFCDECNKVITAGFITDHKKEICDKCHNLHGSDNEVIKKE